AYEAAEREPDSAEQRALLTFVVVGGGPTGVELAGALGEISRQTIARDFRVIDPTKARIVLLEGGARILSAFPESLSHRAEEALRRIGVEVRTSAVVTRVTADAVWLGGEQIRARTVLWAAAVAVVGRFQLSGAVAWLAWLLVHIAFLIGFRNRFLVLFEWAWAYVSWQRGARLITGPWRGRD